MLTFNRGALAEYIALEVENDLNLIDELVGDYLDNSVKLTEAIRTSAGSGDLTLLERSAHSLKSSSRLLGLEALGELAWRIESDARAGGWRVERVAELGPTLAVALNALNEFRAEHRAFRSR